VDLSFTGGEVLLLGRDYLARLFQASRQTFKKTKIRLDLGIQTNLTLMDKAYIKLLKRYRAAVGISFDVFGKQRRFKGGTSIDQAIIDKMILMLQNGLRFGAITVINRSNYRKGKEIFEFFNKIGISFHTINLHPWSYQFCPQLKISERKYVEFLKAMARAYLSAKKRRIHMGIIDSYLNLLENGPGHASQCNFFKSCLGSIIFIENNGEVYPCCSLRYPELYLGNILKTPLEKILRSKVLARLSQRPARIERQCQNCRYVKICGGGCPAYSYLEGDILGRSRSACKIDKAMFKYFEEYLRRKGVKTVLDKIGASA